MSNTAISNAVNQLKQEHIRLCKELARVDEALAALGGLKESSAPARSSKLLKAIAVPKRKVSAAARRKMAEAARARWAARRKEAAAAEKAEKKAPSK